MKSIIAILLVGLTTSVSAQGLRDICENAYYATGYTKLHQYSITVYWARISDHALVELEDIVYGDLFKVLSEKELGENRSRYILKERIGYEGYQYQAALNRLEKITGRKASCVYQL